MDEISVYYDGRIVKIIACLKADFGQSGLEMFAYLRKFHAFSLCFDAVKPMLAAHFILKAEKCFIQCFGARWTTGKIDIDRDDSIYARNDRI
jgi:hypothetical protein